jgi:hypothetical protein
VIWFLIGGSAHVSQCVLHLHAEVALFRRADAAIDKDFADEARGTTSVTFRILPGEACFDLRFRRSLNTISCSG